MLSWPAGAGDLRLRATDDPDATWTEIAPPYTDNGGRMEVTEAVTGGQRFFRLLTP